MEWRIDNIFTSKEKMLLFLRENYFDFEISDNDMLDELSDMEMKYDTYSYEGEL